VFPAKEFLAGMVGTTEARVADGNIATKGKWAAQGSNRITASVLSDNKSICRSNKRELFQEHSLNGHDNASNGDVWREALANYGELVKNGSKPSFVVID
jgi:hypothetical protein